MLIHRVIVGSMHTNSYIVSTGKKNCMLIDPGADATHLIQRLEQMNLVPQTIVFTHGHIDHTSSATSIRDHFKERVDTIQIGIHENDASYLGTTGVEKNREVFSHFGEPGREAFASYPHETPEPDFFISEGEMIPESDLVVFHIGGHTPGSCCFYSEGREALFTGDLLFFNGIGRTDYPEGNDETVREGIQNRLFDLPPETRVFPGHGPLTTVEREQKNNPLHSGGSPF
jgi:glyoxylase-like metal-dependent hydrolase (beta-lactamase superfamily II)